MNISVCKILAVIVFNLLGVGFLMVSQNASAIVKRLAAGKAVLSEGSKAAETFMDPPVPTHVKFYFFNLTNEREVIGGARPRVAQLGPYVYRLTTNKTMKWRDHETTYQVSKAYEFEETLSEGTPDDVITALNPGSLLGLHFNPADVPFLFSTATVHQFLFDGIPMGEDDPVAYFKDQDKPTVEGTFEAFTGEGSIDDLNRITAFSKPDSESLTLACDEGFRGTNGERFPPFSVAPPKVTLFNPKLCRPWDLYYDGAVDVNGLDCVRYSNGRDFFSRTLNKTFDECLEESSAVEDRGIQGIFNSQYCQETMTPILYSLPHFLNADSKLLEDVEGLKPSEEEHSFYLKIYPTLGFVVDMRVRVQVNGRLKAYGNPDAGTENKAIKEVIYPVFWQEMMLYKENSDKAASIVFAKVERPRLAIFWIALVLGALLILAGEILLLSAMFAKRSDEYEDDAYVTYSSRNDRSRVNMR